MFFLTEEKEKVKKIIFKVFLIKGEPIKSVVILGAFPIMGK